MHGGPFANIAHGCNSVTATRMALKLGEIVVTEAGFGADLGAEKFLDIKCRKAGLRPDAVVVVATVRALKHHGGAAKGTLEQEDLAALERGLPNLLAHLENITVRFGCPPWSPSTVSRADTEAELRLVRERCAALGVRVALSEVWAKGGEGGLELADEVLALTEQPSSFRLLYEDALPLREKIETVVRDIYGGDGVELLPAAAQGAGAAPCPRFRRPAGLHRQNPVFPFRQPRPARTSGAFPRHGQAGAAVGRGRVRRGADRRYHDHARPAQSAGGGND